MRCNPVIAVMFLVLGWGSTAENAMAQIGESSLEDLLNIEITTASKFAEPLWEAPGVVTVLTAREIEQFGADNMWQVMGMIPGVQPLYNFQGAKNVLQIRGDLPTISDNHVLILINGRPAASRHSWDGSANSIIYNSFPVGMIERIEVVRGPGSVLYGTNAFTGVINIITKTAEGKQFEIEIQGGSFNTAAGELYASYVKGDFSFSGSLSFLEDDGWDYNLFTGEDAYFEGDAFTESLGFFSTIKYKDFTLQSFLANAETFMLSPAGEHVIDYPNRFFDLGYEHIFNDSWRMQANLSLSSWDYQIIPQNGSAANVIRLVSDDYLGELTLFGQLGDRAHVLFGIVGNKLTGDTPPPRDISPSWSFLWWSAYAQLEYKVTDSLKLIGGFQYNNADGPDDVVPRMGMIINFTESFGAKLLYGEAFRSPYAAERFIDDPNVIIGNPDLVPQSVATTDLQLFYNRDNFQAALTYFDSQQENLIVFSGSDNPNYLITLENVKGVDSNGFEFEGKFVTDTDWYLSFSYTTQNVENGQGVKDVTLAPDSIVKLGLGYSGDSFSFGVFDNYIDEYKDNEIVSPDRLLLNPPSKAVHMVTSQVSYKLSDLDYFFSDMSFEVRADNMLDEELYVPEVFNFGLNSIPGESGRSIQATLRLKY